MPIMLIHKNIVLLACRSGGFHGECLHHDLSIGVHLMRLQSRWGRNLKINLSGLWACGICQPVIVTKNNETAARRIPKFGESCRVFGTQMICTREKWEKSSKI